MYSGYFQHEIQSNLIDVEKLFEAMGYRRLSDDTLVLDGPICPDQVTNVSRDAMAAYVELQIMKNIYMALDANDTTTNWIDILRYREKHTGKYCSPHTEWLHVHKSIFKDISCIVHDNCKLKAFCAELQCRQCRCGGKL